MDVRRVVRFLALCVFLATPSSAQKRANYIQLETDDAFVYMDGEGVAVRIGKIWACRHATWARTEEPLLHTLRQFEQFKSERKAMGDWENWSCGVQPGAVTYSRDVQAAQRALNASPLRPACAPWIPETGRNNWEMLEYDRCLLSEQLALAQAEYSTEFASRLADMLGEGLPENRLRQDAAAVIAELAPKARAKKLGLYDNACDRVVATVYDLVDCRMAGRETALRQAEEDLPRHAGRIEAQRGRDGIEQPLMDGIAADAAMLRKRLRAALGEPEAP